MEECTEPTSSLPVQIVSTYTIANRSTETSNPVELTDPFKFANFKPNTNAEAIGFVKLLIPDPKHRIVLHDLIHDEVESLCKELANESFTLQLTTSLTTEDLQALLKNCEIAASRLLWMMSAISYHGSIEQTKLIESVVRRLLLPENPNSNQHNLQEYPALLTSCIAGSCAVAGQQHHILAAVLLGTDQYEHLSGRVSPSIETLNAQRIFGRLVEHMPFDSPGSSHTPASDYMLDVVKPYVKEYLPLDRLAEVSFDIYEYLLALTFMYRFTARRPPRGRFMWKYYSHGDRSPLGAYMDRIESSDGTHGLLKAGLFGGSADELKKTRTDFWTWANTLGWV